MQAMNFYLSGIACGWLKDRFGLVEFPFLPGYQHHNAVGSGFYCRKNATILSRSASVSCARVCMCKPIVVHCS